MSKVNNPDHYNRGGTEVIEIIEDATEHLRGYPMVGFLVGNIIKYLLRFKHKNGAEDLKKARWYLDRLITTEEESNATTTD